MGIETAQPTETLDVAGTLRVRELAPALTTDNFVTVDADGVFHRSITPSSSGKSTAGVFTKKSAKWVDGNAKTALLFGATVAPIFVSEKFKDGNNTIYSQKENSLFIKLAGRYEISYNLSLIGKNISSNGQTANISSRINVNGVPIGPINVASNNGSKNEKVLSSLQMNELLELDFTLDPTFNIYEASRDLQRARRAEWHETYTMPKLWKFYEPSKISHGSYWHFWGTEQEVVWKKNYQLWMTFINEYKNRGGRVTAGSDSGFIYQLYGFAYIRELELLREAGFHPLEVIRAATLNGAEALGWDDKIGSVQIGKLADFVIVEENPLVNLKVFYGTGAIKLTKDNEVVRVGGVKYTIKDGIVYDAKRLLADVKTMVDKEKAKTNWKLKQPGME